LSANLATLIAATARACGTGCSGGRQSLQLAARNPLLGSAMAPNRDVHSISTAAPLVLRPLMFRWPSQACSARVSCPAFASAKPQACRSMCGWIGNGMPARSPRRADERVEAFGRHRSTPLGRKHMRPWRLLALKAAQGAELVPLDGMHARRSSLGPADVETACRQLDLVPLQIADLHGTQAVPVGDQDHGGVTVPVPARLPSFRH
jgi:hypothetical protein